MIYRLIKKMDTKNKIGKRIISGLITDEKRRKLDKYLKDKARTRMIKQVSDDKDISHRGYSSDLFTTHIAGYYAPCP